MLKNGEGLAVDVYKGLLRNPYRSADGYMIQFGFWLVVSSLNDICPKLFSIILPVMGGVQKDTSIETYSVGIGVMRMHFLFET